MTGCVKLGFTQTPKHHCTCSSGLALGAWLVPGEGLQEIDFCKARGRKLVLKSLLLGNHSRLPSLFPQGGKLSRAQQIVSCFSNDCGSAWHWATQKHLHHQWLQPHLLHRGLGGPPSMCPSLGTLPPSAPVFPLEFFISVE